MHIFLENVSIFCLFIFLCGFLDNVPLYNDIHRLMDIKVCNFPVVQFVPGFADDSHTDHVTIALSMTTDWRNSGAIWWETSLAAWCLLLFCRPSSLTWPWPDLHFQEVAFIFNSGILFHGQLHHCSSFAKVWQTLVGVLKCMKSVTF